MNAAQITQVQPNKSILSRIRDYQRHSNILFESPDFVVRIAATGSDLRQALELRHDVFIEEWQGRHAYHGLDIDNFDFIADHLLICHKDSDSVIGTYRLLSSRFTNTFYSENEFNLSGFLAAPGLKLELGRACIRKDHRKGCLIDLLWKGLTQYIESTKADFLFGCTSIKLIDAPTISRIYHNLIVSNEWADTYLLRPTNRYRFVGFQPSNAKALTSIERRRLMPSLLRSYLHAGAKIYGTPALDLDFGCTDLLTILDWRALNACFKKRYASV